LTKAYFLGNAPFLMGAVFDHCASNFAVCYTAGATGFTNPWYGYPAAACDGTTTTSTTTTTSFSLSYRGLLHPPLLRFSRPVAINNRGDVIGVWFNWANNSAYRTEISFLYRYGIYTKLLPRGWKRAAAWHINDNGEVAGNGYDDDTTNVKGFLYSKGRYTKLLPPGWDWTTTNGLNDNGEVVGFGKDGATIKLFLYSAGQYTEFLPPGHLGGSQFEKLVDINNSGAVVGTTLYGDNTRGFIYKDGAYTELLPPGRVNASALHIADNGAVLIQSGTGPGADVPDKYFIYKDGEYIELLPPGCSYVRPPIDCSDSGAIICEGIDDNYHSRKFFYKEGAYTALSAIGMEPAQAVMNDNGVVFGWGFDSTQTDKWFFFNGKDYTVTAPPPALNNIDQADYYPSEGGKQRFYSMVGINNSEQIIGVVEDIYYIPIPAPWMPDWVITLKQRSFIASLH
jgi:hypothetical protein